MTWLSDYSRIDREDSLSDRRAFPACITHVSHDDPPGCTGGAKTDVTEGYDSIWSFLQHGCLHTECNEPMAEALGFASDGDLRRFANTVDAEGFVAAVDMAEASREGVRVK